MPELGSFALPAQLLIALRKDMQGPGIFPFVPGQLKRIPARMQAADSFRGLVFRQQHLPFYPVGHAVQMPVPGLEHQVEFLSKREPGQIRQTLHMVQIEQLQHPGSRIGESPQAQPLPVLDA